MARAVVRHRAKYPLRSRLGDRHLEQLIAAAGTRTTTGPLVSPRRRRLRGRDEDRNVAGLGDVGRDRPEAPTRTPSAGQLDDELAKACIDVRSGPARPEVPSAKRTRRTTSSGQGS